MPADRSREALGHIRDEVARARAFLGGRDVAALRADLRTRMALEWCLVVIAEASARLRPEVRARLAGAPWTEIADVADADPARHGEGYTGRVWRLAHDALPALAMAVEAELAVEP